MTKTSPPPIESEPSTGRVRGLSRLGRSTPAGIVVATLAVAYTLAIAKPFLVPIAFAWLAKVGLAPLVRVARRVGIPTALAAALIVLSLAGAIGVGVFQLSGPASTWAERLPDDLREIRQKIEAGVDLGSPLEKVNKASKAVENMAGSAPAQDPPLEVAVVNQQPAAQLLGGLWNFSADLVITLVLLYFMLATGDRFLGKIVEMTPRLSDAKTAVTTVHAIESNVSSYLITIVLINLGLGALVGATCAGFGLPNPVLWGVLAAVFNFVPYLGAVAGVVVVAAVGITSSSELLLGLAPAGIYAMLSGVEGMLITPVILGRRLTVSPVFLFLWLLLLSWLWGMPGALLAVPLLVAAKITCDHLPRLAVVGRVLGE